MTHQIDVLSALKCNCLSRCVRAHIVIRLRRLVFLISWKTTGKQMVVYHSKLTVLRCSSATIATCPVFRKNRRSFAWKCFVREQLLLDLAHLETSIQITAVYFRAYTLKSMIHHLSQCHRCVSKHRDRIFEAFLAINRHETFVMQYWMYAGPTNA